MPMKSCLRGETEGGLGQTTAYGVGGGAEGQEPDHGSGRAGWGGEAYCHMASPLTPKECPLKPPSAVGAGPHCLQGRKPSCLTRSGGRAWPRTHRHTPRLGHRGTCSDHAYGFSFSESLTFPHNFCSRKVL
ncbi:hypothetical protein mRhiFer1_008531 [Rhinolophus ferrumequinum]|uniref:Uncharacterized protein n=1 Tax=Rhinolophus ferrumequinum TaxID=59479 RepID=A0A7J7UXH9_RHIFE|nr:hypothetical protein mRhiFer1_008531 [Rhinolophus ferrumequinum]